MKQLIPWVMVVLVAAGVCLWSMKALSQTLPEAKIKLKILYAGTPGSPREGEFVEFLRGYFVRVDTCDVAKLVGKDAAKFDVLLIDAQPKEGTGASALDVPRVMLDQDFARPTMTLSVVGGLFSGGRGLKTGYL